MQNGRIFASIKVIKNISECIDGMCVVSKNLESNCKLNSLKVCNALRQGGREGRGNEAARFGIVHAHIIYQHYTAKWLLECCMLCELTQDLPSGDGEPRGSAPSLRGTKCDVLRISTAKSLPGHCSPLA
jgi:hypothetical protein